MVIFIIPLIPPAFAESTASSLFKTQVSRKLTFDETLRVLESYDFQVIKFDWKEGYIETDYTLVRRKFGARFKVKYKVKFKHIPDYNRLEMKVFSQVKEDEGGTYWVKKHEMKSAWWLIKAVIKRVGK